MNKLYIILFFLFSFSLSYSQVTFTDVAPSLGVADSGAAQGVVLQDFNNDGWLDIFLLNNNTPNKFWINNNGTSFTELSASWNIASLIPGRGLSASDFDNDGKLDVMIGNWQSSIVLYKNTGTSFLNFTTNAGVNFTGYGGSICWFDYNKDGKADVMFTNNGIPPRYNYFFRNENLLSFTNVAYSVGFTDSNSTLTVASGDYDNDGDLDVYMGNQTAIGQAYTGFLYRNEGNGTFTNVTAASQLVTVFYNWGAEWGDYNNDGHLDIFLANYTGLNQLFKNNGNGTFSDVTSQMGINDQGQSYSCGWADYDNDGDLDVYIARSQNNMDRMYRNDGTTFTDVSSLIGMGDLRHSSCVSWGDYNNDGYPDLYLNNNGHLNRLYKNNGGTNKWVQFRLQGTATNRSAIGSRVTVKTGSLTQIREVEGGSGGKGQNSLTLEFGLGSASVIDSVIVRWYNGLTQRFANVAVNNIYTMYEGGPLGVENKNEIPSAYMLYQNYPNPFNPTTLLKFVIPAEAGIHVKNIQLNIYNGIGQFIKSLVNESAGSGLSPGEYEVEFNGTNFSSGLYFYSLLVDGKVIDTKKMMLIK
jgi:hypothetical protein